MMANLHIGGGRRVRRSLWLLLLALALTPAMLTSPPMLGAVTAQALYPFDIGKKYPHALASWRKIASQWKAHDWVYNLNGVAGPVEIIRKNGKVLLSGSVCMPHNCGGNQATFLLAADGSLAAGSLTSSVLTRGRTTRLGAAPSQGN